MATSKRLQPFGTSVFTEMTQLALQHGAINLGQGFPDWDGPDFVKQAAARSMEGGHDQYPPSHGIAELREALALRYGPKLDKDLDPETEITVTAGCTEALTAAFLGLIDPDDLLNPGVIINDDPRAHVTDLKDLPTIEPEVDQCIECGFCESECPSRELTLTPRQRIVVRRAMARIRRDDPGSPVLREIEADYVYDGVETCAADGMCATACPVAIDTGTLVKRLRCDSRSTAAHEMAVIAANRFGLVETAARRGREMRTDQKINWLESAGEERLRLKAERFAFALQNKEPDQLLWEELMAALGYKNNKVLFRQLAGTSPFYERYKSDEKLLASIVVWTKWQFRQPGGRCCDCRLGGRLWPTKHPLRVENHF